MIKSQPPAHLLCTLHNDAFEIILRDIIDQLGA
jgi:hypothetical protein